MPYFPKNKQYCAESDFWCSEGVLVRIFMFLSSVESFEQFKGKHDFLLFVGPFLDAVPDEFELINVIGRNVHNGDIPQDRKIKYIANYRRICKFFRDEYGGVIK